MSDAKQQEQESVETATVETTSQQTLKYGIDTFISANTNRPLKDGEILEKPPVFWCDVCSLKLTPPMSAISHFNGKPHSIQVNKNKGTTPNTTLKRIHPDAKSSSEPSEKVTKKDEDSGITCTDCKITFQNYKMATDHYKGKRHLKRMKEILAPKISVPSRGRGNYSNVYNNRFNKSAVLYSAEQKASLYKQFFSGLSNQLSSFGILNQTSSYSSANLNNQPSSFGSLNQSSSYSSLNQPGGYSSLYQRSSYGDLNQRSSFSSQSGYGLTSGTGLLKDESNSRSMSGNQQSYDNFSTPMNSRFSLPSILPSSNNNFWRN